MRSDSQAQISERRWHRETCICYGCRRARRNAARLAERELSPGRPVVSDEAAARIGDLRAKGFTLTEIAAASDLSVGCVHKASRPGNFIRRSTAEAILSLEETG
jgi:hypothetical protein